MHQKILGLFLGGLLAAGLSALAPGAAGWAAAHAQAPAGHAGQPGKKSKPASKLFVVGVFSGVHAIDLKSGKELKAFETGHIPHNLALSPDGRYVYVTNVGSQSVSVIDARTLTRVKDMLVGSVPDNPAHRKLDPRKLAGATSCFGCHGMKAALGTLPNAMAWAGDGKHLLVSENRGRAVAWLDPATGKTTARKFFKLPTPTSPANMAVQPRTGEVWVLHRWDAPEKKQGVGKPLKVFSMADFAHDPPAGQHFSWVTVHDKAMGRELARIKLNMAVPFSYAWSPDGRWLYVAYRSTNEIAVFDAAKRTLARRFKVGVTPTGLAISPDGRKLYSTLVFSNPAVVQVIDPLKGEVLESLQIPPSPELVKVDPATGYVYVSVAGYNRILELDLEKYQILRELPSGHQPLDLLLVP
jgi:YVTN family beta-propeller protein